MCGAQVAAKAFIDEAISAEDGDGSKKINQIKKSKPMIKGLQTAM